MKIGNIVTFRSHPYVKDTTKILISGEHILITPLMLIVETLNVLRDEHSEVDGTTIAVRGNIQCKCIWFSSKSNQFEESWFYSSQLKIVVEAENEIGVNDPTSVKATFDQFNGKLVALKSLPIELGKKKSNLSSETGKGINDRDKTTITSLLSFVSPVMQIIDVKENDLKEIRFDAKTGKQRKFLPKYNVKCRWFNPSSDKFSEKILPLDVILVLPVLSEERIQLLQTHIDGLNTIFKIKKALVKPVSLSYRSGYYYLTYFDFITNRYDEVNIDDDFVIYKILDLYLSEAPDFNLIATHPGVEWKTVNTIADVINRSIADKSYLRIHYIDPSENITVRTLHNLVLHTVLEATAGATSTIDPAVYVEAHCNLRNAKRFFKIDRIAKAQQLNIAY